MREIKYFKITETYWIVKEMVAQALEKTRKEQGDILHTP